MQASFVVLRTNLFHISRGDAFFYGVFRMPLTSTLLSYSQNRVLRLKSGCFFNPKCDARSLVLILMAKTKAAAPTLEGFRSR